MRSRIKALKEQHANKNYLPPQQGVVFIKMWNALINQVVNNKNFNEVFHLANLETLCCLYQEEKHLMSFLANEGETYEVPKTKKGLIFKTRPEKLQLNSCRAQIRSYCKALGLDLTRKEKDKSMPVGETNKDSSWE